VDADSADATDAANGIVLAEILIAVEAVRFCRFRMDAHLRRMQKGKLLHATLTRSVIGAFFEVYDRLGYRYPERFYKTALEHELRLRGHLVEREVLVEVRYKGIVLGMKRLDMRVDHVLVLEVKSGRDMHHSFRSQLLSYLEAVRLELGLVLNFGPKPQFERVISSLDYHKLQEGQRPRHPRSPRPPAWLEVELDGPLGDDLTNDDGEYTQLP
jgi:GxxExxY protein